MKVKLEDVCVKDSSSLKQSDIINDGGEYPIYGASGYIGKVNFYHQEMPYVAIVKDGAGIGRTLMLPGKSSVIGTMQYLIPKESIRVEYLYYVVRYMHLEKYFSGATIPHIYFRDYKNEVFNLATIEEQERIIRVLNGVSRIIEFRKKQLGNLDELIKARFVEMFGDLADPNCCYYRCKLVDACVSSDDIKCGPFGTQLNKEEYQDTGVAVWEIPQINSGFREMPVHYISETKAKELTAYSLISGDIAMSRKGNVGKCGLYPADFLPGIIHSDVLRIRVDNRRVNSCFMMYQLHFSRDVQRQIEIVSSGAIMAGINVTKLKQIFVYLPKIEEQKSFADFVNQVDKSKFIK